MQKWLRRGLYAGLTAGFVAGSVGIAHADDTTVVSPGVKSETTSVVGDNSILGGNGLSAPVVAPVTGNDVAIAGIGGAVNADEVLAVLGVLGFAHGSSCGDDDYVEVSGFVDSSTTSVAGDNSIGSGNSASVPVYAPITDNKGAGTVIGGAVNAEEVAAVLGALGAASCGDGDGDGPYATSAEEQALPVAGGLPAVGDLANVSNLVGVEDIAALTQTLPTGDVASLLGLGLLGGSGLQGAGQTVSGVADTATGGVAPAAAEEAAVSGEASTEGSSTVATEAQAEEQAATLHANDDTTVVAPNVASGSTSVAGDNSIGSGNSASIPVVVPVTDNDVAVAGIGGAVNGEDVTVVASVLGTASALLD